MDSGLRSEYEGGFESRADMRRFLDQGLSEAEALARTGKESGVGAGIGCVRALLIQCAGHDLAIFERRLVEERAFLVQREHLFPPNALKIYDDVVNDWRKDNGDRIQAVLQALSKRKDVQ